MKKNLLFVSILFYMLDTHAQLLEADTIIYHSSGEAASVTKDKFALQNLNRSIALFQDGAIDSAIEYAKNATELDSSYWGAFRMLAILYSAKEKFDLAEKYAAITVNLSPTRENYLNLAQVLQLERKNTESIAILNKLIDAGDNSCNTSFMLAQSYFHNLQIDEAIKMANKSVSSIDQQNADLLGSNYLLLGLCYLSKGDKISAKDYLKQAEQAGINVHDQYKKMVED